MKQLTTEQVIHAIRTAVENKAPLSLVRIGDGENIVLAQQSVWPLKRIYQETWAKKAKKGKKGIFLPDIHLRNHMVKAVKNADIVGLLPNNDQKINAPSYLKRPLTNKIFAHFKLSPKVTCDATVMRECADNKHFWEIFRGKKILVMYEQAELWAEVLKRKYGVNVTMAIPFTHYNQLQSSMKTIQKSKQTFDVALLACGVNSVPLAYEIVRRTGKVAIDFGKPAKFMVLSH
ncbi:hypothetical protein SAMN05192534_12522 [Alteribacillus persepolensis]|uniref:GT-D fold-like domain-containing protein n=1 Tax=Alteribacillus persepolensis TaxID=568899 RepID=A0A1G8IRQ4_9BACI|nr:GT-D fold domain-containing glycosyltransferase [Alteribacillus persepolensis]SDI21150.1 hypothetical protein SAMN05192534_12522 [Alteribacillus persepolensis]